MYTINVKDIKSAGQNEHGHERYVFKKLDSFERTIHLVPWYTESWGTLSYFIAFSIAQKMRIKIIAYGDKNLLPFLSLISHEAVVCNFNVEDSFFSRHSNINNFPINLYEDIFIYNENIILEIAKIIFPQFSYEYDKYKTEEYSSTGPKSLLMNHALEILQKSSYWENDYYKINNIFLDHESKKVFQKLADKYPKNSVWCEIKKDWYEDVEKIILNYFDNDFLIKETLSMQPYNKQMQKKIFSNYPDHYMAIQILISISREVRFIGVGGSANIFSVLPVRSLFLLSKEAYFDKAVRFKKEFEKKYFNNNFEYIFTSAVRYLNLTEDDSDRCKNYLKDIETIFKKLGCENYV